MPTATEAAMTMSSKRRTANCGYESPMDEHPPFGMATASPRPGISPLQQPQASRRAGAAGEGNQPRSYSLNGVVEAARNTRPKIGIRERIRCYQWTWFTMTMVCIGSLFVDLTVGNMRFCRTFTLFTSTLFSFPLASLIRTLQLRTSDELSDLHVFR